MIYNLPRSAKQVDPWPNNLNAVLEFASDAPFKVACAYKKWNGVIEYNNGSGWQTWGGESIASSDRNGAQSIYFRGTGNTNITVYNSGNWTLSGSNISCNGNIETLLDWEQVVAGSNPVMSQYCFARLFKNCEALVKAPDLPSTILGSYCYMNMFEGCTGLLRAPALPATALKDRCYNGMFNGCTSLTEAPDLPSTDLASGCYWAMFSGCTSLKKAPALPALVVGSDCYNSMFRRCTSLREAPALPATVLKSQTCYSQMFSGCTSLITAPALPAKTVPTCGYEGMFDGCTSLKEAPALPATTLSNKCYATMFRGCTNLTTPPPTLPAETLLQYSYDKMFYGCKSLTAAPQIMATTLGYASCRSMFEGCTNLTQIHGLSATATATDCCVYMFKDCTSLKMITALPALTLASGCYSAMFRGCTGIKLSATQAGSYTKAYRVPTSGNGKDDSFNKTALTDMFTATGGTFTGTPTINTTYYLDESNTISGGGAVTKKINFTIESTSYEADEGMTWEQWVNSSYNTGGFVIQGQKIMRNNYVVRKNSGGDALSSDYIVSGTFYALVSQHNGGAG